MRFLRWTALLALVATGIPRSAEAGAWIRPPGHFFLKLGTLFGSFSNPENALYGLQQSSVEFWLFAEIGLPWRMDLVIEVPYIIATNSFESEGQYRNHSVGDTRLQLDRGLLSAIQLTGALEVKLPTYRPLSSRTSTGLIQINEKFFPVLNFPELGSGVAELTPKLLYGKSFHPRPAWLTAEVGFRARFEGLAHGIYGALGVGAWVWPEHLAFALYGKGSYEFGSAPDPKRPNGEEPEYAVYLAGQFILTAAPWAPWLKLWGSAGGVVAAAKKTSTEFGLGLAVEY